MWEGKKNSRFLSEGHLANTCKASENIVVNFKKPCS